MAHDPANDDAPTDRPPAGRPNVRGYFRRLFAEHPAWLAERRDTSIIDRWLHDHPGHVAMPPNIRHTLAALKSALRRQADGRPLPRGLEPLELRIDDCLARARELDALGMDDIIEPLRQARDAVRRKRKK